MVVRSVVMVGVVAGLSLALLPPAPIPRTKEWPCPIAQQIDPCVCSSDTSYNLFMECSNVTSSEELEKVFAVIFPFDTFKELKINHDPDDVLNTINEITANTFGERTFERIIITGTMLNTVIDEAFAGSHDTLVYLDLSNNQLEAFPFEALSSYSKLTTFIINDNKFPLLYDLDSPTLEEFSASRNPNMKLYSERPFDLAPSLRSIVLSEIGLTSLTTEMFLSLTKMEMIDLSFNHIERLEENSLSVTGNTLLSVNLEQNGLYFTRHDALNGLHPDAKVNMANNEFIKLEEPDWGHIFRQMGTYSSIDLSGNPLLCGCEIDWLLMHPENGKLLCMLTDETRCDTGEQVIYLPIDVFCDNCAANPSECPEQIEC